MTKQEIRMRCIEALTSSGGIRETARIIRDAQQIEEWVLAAEDKPDGPQRGRPPKADKE